MAKKLSTSDILKKIREQGAVGDGAAADSDAAAEEAAVEESVADTPVEESAADASAAPSPKAAPKGTSDILAAIRAQGAGGEQKPKSSAKAAPKKSPAKAAPKGTSDILAAIRGQGAVGGGGGGAAATESPAKPAAKKKAAATAPAGDLPPVKEMLEQMRRPAGGGGKAVFADEAVDPKPAAKAKPAKKELRIPKRPSKAEPKKETRRSFLVEPLFWAWGFFTVTCAAWLLGLARFMFPNVLVEPPTQFKIGPASDYPLGTVSTKWTAARGIWVVHTDQYKGLNSIYALASVCTHLGCTPSWLEGEQKFKCPCHGSGFYITGINFEGPAPRPLERVGLRVAPDGMLEVDKSVKFQEEKGQWEDENSFVDASLLG